MTHTSSAGNGRSQLAWLPIPVLLAAMVVLRLVDSQTPYESRWLMAVLNFICSTAASLLVAVLIGRSYMVRGEPGLLLLGCGVLFWGAAGSLTPLLIARGSNALIGYHNSLACISALCHLAGVWLSLAPRRQPVRPGLALLAAYAGTLGVVWLVEWWATQGPMPLFFVQGRGGTTLRAAVLGSAIVLFVLTAAMLLWANRRLPSAFVRWYGMALLLVATGLLGVMIQSAHGSLLGWTGRAAQFLGGLYMLVAALASVRESGAWTLPISTALRDARQRYEELLDLAADGVLVHDLGGLSSPGSIRQVNPALCRILGYASGELRALSPLDLFAPEDRPATLREYEALARDEILRHEKTMVAKDGRRVHAEIAARRYGREDRWMVLSVIRDISERKRAEAERREQSQRHELVVRGAHAAIWDWDVLRHKVDYSPAWKNLRGYDAAELGDGEEEWSGRIHPEDAPRVLAAVQAHFEGRTPVFAEEYRVRCKDGSWKWIADRGQALHDESGRVIRMAGSEEDISGRKAAEEALRESEAKYRLLFENMADGFALYELLYDAQGKPSDWCVLEVNDAYERHTGIARERIAGRRVGEVFPAAIPEYLPCFAEVVAAQKPLDFETFSKPAGRHLHVVTFPAGRNRFASLIEDVTARKQAEQALKDSRDAALNLMEDSKAARRNAERAGLELRESEQRMQQALRVSRSFTFEWEPATDRVRRSASCETILHLAGDEAVSDSGQRFFQRVHPDDRERFARTLRGLTPDANAYTTEYRVACGDGETVVLEETGQASFDAEGRLQRLVGVAADVTARKRAERELDRRRRREELLAGVVNRLLVADDAQLVVNELCTEVMHFLDADVFFNFLADEKSGRLRLNACAGIAPEEAAKIEWLDYGVAVCGCVAKEGRRIIVSDVQHTRDPRATLVAGYGVQAYCCHPLLSQGRLIGTLSFGARRRTAFSDDDIATMAAVAAQVTVAMQRIRDLEALRESEDLYRRTLQALPAHIAVIDRAGRIISVNQAWLDFARHNNAGDAGPVAVGASYLDACRKAVAENDPEALRALDGIESVLKGDRDQFTLEYPCHGPLEQRWFLMTVVPFGAGGAVITHLNITALKRAEEELVRTRRRLESLVAQAPVGVAFFDRELRYVLINEQLAAMNGVPVEAHIGRYVGDIVPTLLPAVLDVVDRIRATGQPVKDHEFSGETVAAPGEIHYWSESWYPVRDGTGDIIGFGAVAADITARKKAEEALRESESFYRQTLESVPGMTFTTRADGYCDYQSQQWEDHTGVPAVEHLGDGWNNLLHPDDRPRAYAAWRAAVEGRAPYDLEYRVRRHDGVYEWFKVRGRPICDAKGAIVRWFGTAVNIDSLVNAEEQVRRSLAEKDVLLKEVHHRVKNNLQVISSLVSLQSSGQADPAVRTLLEDMHDRVRTMALVHEKLYESESLSDIGFADYARSLLLDLWRVHGRLASPVRLTLDLKPVSLPVHVAVPCGLILNELAVNALKHAFPDGAGGEVSVALHPGEGGRVTLRVRDNGVGLRSGLDWRQAMSLGLRLVQMLARQLKGAVEARPVDGGGTEFEVVFTVGTKE